MPALDLEPSEALWLSKSKNLCIPNLYFLRFLAIFYIWHFPGWESRVLFYWKDFKSPQICLISPRGIGKDSLKTLKLDLKITIKGFQNSLDSEIANINQKTGDDLNVPVFTLQHDRLH